MVNPIFLLPVLAAKKVAIYYAAKAYGFPRIYASFLREVKKMNLGAIESQELREDLKRGFRHPTELISILQKKNVHLFLYKYSESTVISSPEMAKNFAVEGLKLTESLLGRVTKPFR